MKLKNILISGIFGVFGLLFIVGIASADMGSGINTSPLMRLDGTDVLMLNSSWDLGSEAIPIHELVVTTIKASSTITDTLTVTATTTSPLLLDDGTAGAPAYSFMSDPNSGLYRIGADNIGVALGGSLIYDFGATSFDIGGMATVTLATGNIATQGDLTTVNASTTLLTVADTLYLGTGTTTASNGFDITAGCFALNGTCMSSTVGGTVTSVDFSVPTGLAIANNPITTSGTLALTYHADYSAVKTASSTNWNTFYDTPSNRITDGTGLSWSTNTLNAEVQTSDLHNAVTIGTANGLSLSTQVLSMVAADTSTTGALTSTDWNTFNNKWDLASSTIAVAYGGTGSTTLTGILKGNGTSQIQTAVGGTDYETPITFSTGLTDTDNTVTVNTSQNIATLSNLTNNGFVKTSGGGGTLSVDTSTYLTGNETITLSSDITGSGATSIVATIADNAVDGTDISLASEATGDLMTFNGTDWVVLATSTDAYVLTLDANGWPSWAAPAGGGDVSKVGTPADSQVGVWTGDGTIEGAASLTYDGSNLQLTGDVGSTGTKITKGWFTNLMSTNAIAGSITGNAATVSTIAGLAPNTATTQATQGNITSLGTLTTLTVDNINLNGSTISGVTTDANTVLTAYAGKAIAVEGVSFDGGVITGATLAAASNVIEADTVTNATLTTALTVDTGTVTLTGAGANSSVLTIDAGAVSVGGANTGDQDLSGYALKGVNTDITSLQNTALYVGRDADNKINWGTDDHLKITIAGTETNIASITNGVADNDKLVTQGYVDDNVGASFASIADINALLTGEDVASTTASNANFVNDAGYTGATDISGKADVDQTMYIGSTAVAINRTTATLNLTGIGTLNTHTIQGGTGTLALTTDITGTNSGTNTGDDSVNSNYSGLITNATHTGDATGSGALTVVKINGTLMSGLGTGILKNTTTTGVPSIAVAGDFPTLNQNTTGSSATLTTPRAINGVDFNGSTAITVTADANTLSNTTLKSTVITSSLTSVGALTSGSLGAGFTDVPIAQGGTGASTLAGASIPTYTSTNTFTNKRITQRVVTTANDATAEIDIDITDVYELSAIADDTTFTLTGTPTDGQKLIVRYKDDGGTETLTWTGFTALGITLPTDTTAGKWEYVGCTYNSAATAWHCIANVLEE